MGKIALLVPREEMLYLAHNILQEKPYAIADMRVTQTENAVMEARNAIAGGADIIIARGLQASLIKQYTDVPVVEIAATAQEMALLIIKAKQIVKREHPVIAVVGFRNMFCDMSYFETIYDIKLRTYFAANGTELRQKALEAMEEGAELMIGGDTVVAAARETGFPSLFLSITEDSLRTAFSMAESLDFAMGAEKRSNAQLEAILDYSFNGVVNMDRMGIITAANPVMRDILGEEGARIVGQSISQVFPDIDDVKFAQVLAGKEESYSSFLQANKTPVFAILAPVMVGKETEGAILTCHKVKRRQPAAKKETREGHKLYQGLVARADFETIPAKSRAMRECVHLARLYSQSQDPVLLLGEMGTERRLLAESIHNAGPCGKGPFLPLYVGGLTEQEQESMIFGDKGALSLADGGSLYLEDVEELSLKNQYGLYQLIRRKMGSPVDFVGNIRFNIRVIASTTLSSKAMARRMGTGEFRRDLYYVLMGLTVQVPPFRERPEDLKALIHDKVKEACEQYSRYHVLTQGAAKCLEELPWPGNIVQLETFLRRLVLTAGKRSIDEILVGKLWQELYPDPGQDQGCEAGTGPLRGPLDSEEERRIRKALATFQGNREQTAKSLEISKATLWRKMKKYRIESFEGREDGDGTET